MTGFQCRKVPSAQDNIRMVFAVSLNAKSFSAQPNYGTFRYNIQCNDTIVHDWLAISVAYHSLMRSF